MSTDKTWQTVSTSSDDTEKLAEQLGQNLRGGEVIELVSDLGGGKTTFVRGLARGLGSEDRVASPTFTVSKVYTTSTLELHHFDFYRLTDPGIIAHEIQEVTNDPKAITVVEWGEVVRHVLPKDRLTIKIKHTGDESRQLEFLYPEKLNYLMERLC